MNDGSEQGNKGPGKDDNFTIIVNGRQKTVTKEELTFADVVALAFNPVPTGPNIVFTITFKKADGKKTEGNLDQGETVKIKNGTMFNVTQTDKS
jgi:hypothetical protein